MAWFVKKRRLPRVGATVVYCESFGCQGMDKISWVGTVACVDGNTVYVRVIKRNNSYKDIRDIEPTEVEELYVPVGNGDLQKVGRIWIMFR